jgi:hypothetical protein
MGILDAGQSHALTISILTSNSYSNWSPGQPNNSLGVDNFGNILAVSPLYQLGWNDAIENGVIEFNGTGPVLTFVVEDEQHLIRYLAPFAAPSPFFGLDGWTLESQASGGHSRPLAIDLPTICSCIVHSSFAFLYLFPLLP